MEFFNVIIKYQQSKVINDKDEDTSLIGQNDKKNILYKEENNLQYVEKDQDSDDDNIVVERKKPSSRVMKNCHIDNIIENLDKGVITKRIELFYYRDMISNVCFILKTDPKDVKQVLGDELQINTIQEELVQFERNKYDIFFPKHYFINVIYIKWIYKNNYEENRYVTRNKASLVAHGYTPI